MLTPYVESIEGLPDLDDLELPPLPDNFDQLDSEVQAHVVKVRDTQQAILDLRHDLGNLNLTYAPVVLTTAVYHLALCGWRRTAQPTGKVNTSVRLAEALLLDDLRDPRDARGASVDFRFAPALRDAIARYLAQRGWRLDYARRLIKARPLSAIAATGVWDDAVVWVPIDAPDRAEDDLRPDDTADSTDRPADVRALAARRDGIQPLRQQLWSVKPTVNFIDEERPPECD
ncbi:minor tail protein [Mycobacterium phage MalagasyRose]|uniref:Minor tail protein n=1 Tax=Mycobacterium phage MalagasyRose TaxID=2599870 RepID=A0A5J6TE47_9CAUD|nr:minor tail protein [Mycobacterium phage MalagasyRose]QFG08875.1 minor tail protein [Mycobacterium phage MalagasyRose]